MSYGRCLPSLRSFTLNDKPLLITQDVNGEQHTMVHPQFHTLDALKCKVWPGLWTQRAVNTCFDFFSKSKIVRAVMIPHYFLRFPSPWRSFWLLNNIVFHWACYRLQQFEIPKVILSVYKQFTTRGSEMLSDLLKQSAGTPWNSGKTDNTPRLTT